MYRNNQKKSDRIKFILLLNKGSSYEKIADILLVDDTTVRRWYKIISANGIKTLSERQL
ncbi:MAG: helix-turn-helix domain-containing protein [Deltaproteobacteria bacterium]|nr:helix-turn-helix domain-containing protein [Deltaproteobacteria bacterium]